jgi:hypothetical protein
LNNSDTESALIHYDLRSGAMVRKYSLAGRGHSFNDLAFAPEGEIYLTDTLAGAVWHLDDLNSQMESRFQRTGACCMFPVYPIGIIAWFDWVRDMPAIERLGHGDSQINLRNCDGRKLDVKIEGLLMVEWNLFAFAL